MIESGLNVKERSLTEFIAADVLQQIKEAIAPQPELAWIPLMQDGNELGMIEK